jgi:hypothetical protein
MMKRNATHVTDEHSSTHFWLHWQQTFTLGRTLSKTCHPLSLLPTDWLKQLIAIISYVNAIWRRRRQLLPWHAGSI